MIPWTSSRVHILAVHQYNTGINGLILHSLAVASSTACLYSVIPHKILSLDNRSNIIFIAAVSLVSISAEKSNPTMVISVRLDSVSPVTKPTSGTVVWTKYPLQIRVGGE